MSTQKPKASESGAAFAVIVIGAAVALYLLNNMNAPSATSRSSVGTSAAQAAAATATPPPAHIGTTVRLGNWQYRVVQVDTAKAIDISTSQFFKTVMTAKGLFVMVMIDLTNIGNRNFSINSHDFELRDDKGIHYDPDFSNGWDLVRFRGQTQLGEQFPPGVTLRTTILFDVAPGTNGMYLFLDNASEKGVIYLF